MQTTPTPQNCSKSGTQADTGLYLMAEAKIALDDGSEKSFKLEPKVFKTGSRGFHGFGKIESAGKRFQVNILVVEIGSKERNKNFPA